MRTGQILQFPLSRGLDEDSNAKAKPLAALKAGNNIRWPKNGVIGKRHGVAVVGSVPTQIAKRFMSRGSELCAITSSGEVTSHDPVASLWRSVASAGKTELEWTSLNDDNAGVAATCQALSGNHIIHAWVSGDPTRHQEQAGITGTGNGFVQVLNRNTGQVILAPTKLTAADPVHHVKVLVSGSYAFVFYTAGAKVSVMPVNLTTMAVGSVQDLHTDRTQADRAGVVARVVDGRFDVICKANGQFVLVYERDLTTSTAIVAALYVLTGSTFALSTSVEHTDGTRANMAALAIAEDTAGDQIVVLYSQIVTPGTQVRIRALDRVTLTSLVAVTAVSNTYRCSQVSLAVISSGIVAVAYSGYDVGSVRIPSLITERWTITTGSGAAVVARTSRRSIAMALISRFFTLGSELHVFAADGADGEDNGDVNSQNTFPSTYLLRVDTLPYSATISGNPPHALQGKVDHDIGGIFQSGNLPQAAAVDSATVYALLPYQADDAQASFNWRVGLRLVRATQTLSLIADPWRSVTIGQEAYIKGAYLAAYDGGNVFDFGMRTPISILVQEATVNGAAYSSTIANGSYVYQFAPGFRSRAGVLHRGPLSVQITTSITTYPNGGTSLRLASHGIDGKQADATLYGANAAFGAYIEAFRTEANGSVLYQLTMPPRYNIIPNDPSAETNDYTDVRWDSDIGGASDEEPTPATIELSTRPQPYTATGELEDVQPPAQYTIHFHNGRVFIVTGGKREIWYSKDIKENPGIAPGFSPDQRELYDQNITALSSMDEKRIIFWKRGIWYVVGDGPAVTGLDNRFSSPYPIQTDVGCTNPRSVVSTPMGIIFQCDSDLYLLERNLTVTWIGQAATDTLASYPTITSAVLVPSQAEVRFTCNNTGGTAGIVLVFDYSRNTWFTRTYPGGAAIDDATLHDGVYYAILDGMVWYENTAVHYDVVSAVSTFVVSTVELDHIGPSGPIGWQRVRVVKPIGQALSNHSMTVSAARDYATTYEQTQTFSAGSDVTAVDGYARCELALTVQRRQSVGIKITDAAPSNTTLYPLGNGAGFQLEGIALLVQPKTGLPRDTSSRRGG